MPLGIKKPLVRFAFFSDRRASRNLQKILQPAESNQSANSRAEG